METLEVHLVIETSQRGTFATAKLLYEKLRARGHEVSLWTTFPSGFKELPRPRVLRPLGYETSVNLPGYARAAIKAMRPGKDSIVHAMNAMHELVYLARKKGLRSLVTVQYPWPICYFNAYGHGACGCTPSYLEALRCIAGRRRGARKALGPLEAAYWLAKRRWIRRNLTGSCAIVAVSRSTRDLLASAGYPPEKIHVVYVNALMPRLPEYSEYEPSDRFTFAYLSYPDEGKGVFQLLRAFALAVKRNDRLRLKVYGGLESPDVARLVRDLGLGSHVELTAWAPFDRYIESLREMLRDVDVVVVPTLVFDTWARVVTEAMLSGRPVMVTKGNGGLVEQVEDNVTGFHVNVYDLEEFAEGLFRVSSIPRDEIRKMGLRAREEALKRWGDQDKIVADLEAIYKSVAC